MSVYRTVFIWGC